MIYTKTDEKIRVEAGTYTLEVTAENIAVILAGERVALLRLGSAVNVLKADGEIGEDKAEGELTCNFADKRDADGSYVFTWTGKSANWEKKEYVVRAKENSFEYFVRVTSSATAATGSAEANTTSTPDICPSPLSTAHRSANFPRSAPTTSSRT